MMKTAIQLAERGYVPRCLISVGIRRLLAERLREFETKTTNERDQYKKQFIAALDESALAIETNKANEQHYEVPSLFYTHALGRHLKYSSGYWPDSVTTLDDAEAAMLALTCERAQLQDGMEILELGCGWGSLSLWMAERYPASPILAISNSKSQRAHIEAECRNREISNLTVETCDINHFKTDRVFDRVVSVEMFEHVRNYKRLFHQIAGWMKADAKLFVHIFSHREYPYFFETEGDRNWMGRYFFTGGVMPSDDLFSFYQEDLRLEDHWWLDGSHYQKTALAWLRNMEIHRETILPLFAQTYGVGQERLWYHRWRIFFLACAELFGYRQGSEWGVSHYTFTKQGG